MGLFGRLLGKEGAQPKEVAEAPKAEAAEVKNAKEIGRERVDKMVESGRAAKDAVIMRAGSSLARVGGAMRDAFFATIGGAEKGGKAAVKGTVEAGKATAQYARETKAEAGQIITSGIEAGNKLDADVADFLKANATAGVDKLNVFADWALLAEKELKEKVPGVHADVRSRTQAGLTEVGANIASVVTDGIKKLEAFGDWVKGAQKEFKTKSGEVNQDVVDRAEARIVPVAKVIEKFITNVVDVPRDAQKEWDILRRKAGAAKDRFINSANEARLKAAGAAEMKGEIEALRKEVARLADIMETKKPLSAVVPESKKAVIGSEQVDENAETLPKTVTK